MNGRNLRRVLGLCLAAGFLASACGAPSRFVSPLRDFTCEVPPGWRTIVDSESRDFHQATFVGPFNTNFYKGAPSLGIRWYRSGKPHRLPDGTIEVYSSPEDFMRQMLRDVYGPDGYAKAGDDRDQSRAEAVGKFLPDFERIKFKSSRDLEGLFFVVYHNQPAPAGAEYGAVVDEQGRRFIRQRHGYAILPVREGFYVLVYPATRDGFEIYKRQFLRMVNSFHLLSEGPR